jgi:PEP-CTERM motif-containing protein
MSPVPLTGFRPTTRSPSCRRALLATVATAVVLCAGSGGVAAAPISVTNVFDILDSVSVNDIGLVTGNVLFLGSNQVSPNGANGTTGTAQTTNTLTSQTLNWNLGFRGDTAFPNQISTGLGPVGLGANGFPFGGVPDDPGLRGPWTLTFRNGSDTTVVTTPSLVGVTPLPFASSVKISGSGANPTFNWTNPPGADRVFINIVDKDRPRPGGGFDDVLNMGLPAGATSFTVPTQLAGGLTLDPTHHYAIEISATKLRDPSQPLMHSNELAISRAILNFNVLSANSPPNVYLPSVDPAGGYHFNIAVVKGQTVFIDPAVAIGYKYAIGAGNPNFASVTLPPVGDNIFTLFYLLGGDPILQQIIANAPFFFPSGGVSAFDVTGIETSAMLDPNNVTAFITGLTFVADGDFTGTMIPLVTDVALGPVPEPTTLFLFGTTAAGLGLAARWRQRRRKQ